MDDAARDDWVALEYRDLSSDRRWWDDRCDQPLPEELRAYLDGLRRPPSPFTSEAFLGPAMVGITTDGRLRYDLAPVGDSRPLYLDPAPVETWIESIGTQWDAGCRKLLAAHGLVERARDILADAGVDLDQFRRYDAFDGVGYRVKPHRGGVSLSLYTSDMPDFLIRVFDDDDLRVGVTWLSPDDYSERVALGDEQLMSPYSAARTISRVWRDAALSPYSDGPRVDARMGAVARWTRAQGALAGAEVDIRPRFANAGGRVEISSWRIRLVGPRGESPTRLGSLALEMTAADPGTVTVVEEEVWGSESRESLPVREAMDRVRRAFPDTTTAVLDPAPAATVYTKENCIACQMTERQFARAGVDVEVVRLEDHPEVVERAREMGLMSAPLVATPDGRITSGFDPQRIRDIAALASAPPGAGLAVSQPRPEGGIAASPAPERGRGMGL
ncbi:MULTISPECIES: glutaredoxin domain-containing protein [Actinomyces]|uniref:Glutaredoxin domain-containing protein n=1 Tax=Actinomyces marmotae TaxID=2737173 RepID=A0A6M8AY79_9ACTO|nr:MULTISPECIES: glutaredoxin domain-containing protein [Actinomyces]QKD79449.1 hypothetical protein HPC72_03550 [Actinomyces marmotae]